MIKLKDIADASVEDADEPGEDSSRQVVLARRLEAAGHRTIAVGRAMVTIERTESPEEAPSECRGAEVLKLSIYSDPDVSGDESPVCLFLEGGRFGLAAAYLRIVAPDGRERIFKMEDRLVRDELG